VAAASGGMVVVVMIIFVTRSKCLLGVVAIASLAHSSLSISLPLGLRQQLVISPIAAGIVDASTSAAEAEAVNEVEGSVVVAIAIGSRRG